jgi:glutathione-regulated potassium-efflux system ancillary protein KefC
MYPHHKDRAKFIAVAREGRNQFAEQMARERQESAAMHAASSAYPGYGEHPAEESETASPDSVKATPPH